MMKNKTIVTFAEHTALNKVILRLRSFPLIVVYMIAVLVFSVYGFITANYVIGIAGAVIFIVFPVLWLLFFKKKNKDTYNEELYKDMHYEFEFTEEMFQVTLVRKEIKNELKTNYKDLYMVVEAKDNIFIFIDSKRAYIVSVKGFENFSREDFRNLVQTKVKKYRILGK